MAINTRGPQSRKGRFFGNDVQLSTDGIDRLLQQFSGKDLVDLIMPEAEAMAEHARANVHVQTGRLKSTIRTEVIEAREGFARVQVTAGGIAFDGHNVDYAPHEEFHNDHPYMRPAYEAIRYGGALERIRERARAKLREL